jgi:integrase
MGTIKKRVLGDGKARYDVRVHRRRGTGTKSGTLSKTFEKESDAKAWMRKIEGKIDEGESVSRIAEKLTLARAAAIYLAEARPMTKAAKAKAAKALQKAKDAGDEAAEAGSNITDTERLKISAVVEDLGHYHLGEITHGVIQSWIDEFLKRPIPFQTRKKEHPYFNGGLDKDGKQKLYSKSTVRGHYFVLKKILTWSAIRHKFQLEPHLFELLDIPPAWEGRRERRLEDGEEGKLREAFTRGYKHREAWGLLMTVALETAARMQEMLKAEWPDINYRLGGWNIPEENVKTSVFRNVPMSTRCRDAFKAMEAFKVEGEPRVFHQWADSSTLSKAFRRVVNRAEIADFHFHDLRHEACVRFFENTDLTDTEIMSITGHTSHEMLKGYSKHRMNKLAARLDGVKRAA